MRCLIAIALAICLAGCGQEQKTADRVVVIDRKAKPAFKKKQPSVNFEYSADSYQDAASVKQDVKQSHSKLKYQYGDFWYLNPVDDAEMKKMVAAAAEREINQHQISYNSTTTTDGYAFEGTWGKHGVEGKYIKGPYGRKTETRPATVRCNRDNDVTLTWSERDRLMWAEARVHIDIPDYMATKGVKFATLWYYQDQTSTGAFAVKIHSVDMNGIGASKQPEQSKENTTNSAMPL